MIGKILYAGLGIALSVIVVITGVSGLNEKNVAVYTKAIALQNKMTEVGFADFFLEDYPVRFFDGDADYVITTTNGKQNIKKEKPIITTFVGTAYKVEGAYEVIVPTLEAFSRMNLAFATASNLESDKLEFDTNGYGGEEHAATIWHEAFHAYQQTKYSKEIKQWGKPGKEALLVAEVDENPKVKRLIEQELVILKKAVLTESVDEIQRLLLEYKELEEQRQSLLSEKAQHAEAYLETIEGMARYIESQAYMQEYGKERWQEQYLESIETYVSGNGKYYAIGMAKALLLDRVDAEWKATFDFSNSITNQLYENMEQKNDIT